jgi:hypothetical protein
MCGLELPECAFRPLSLLLSSSLHGYVMQSGVVRLRPTQCHPPVPYNPFFALETCLHHSHPHRTHPHTHNHTHTYRGALFCRYVLDAGSTESLQTGPKERLTWSGPPVRILLALPYIITQLAVSATK